MRLKVKEVSFTNNNNWLFKLSDSFDEYYIMDTHFYNKIGVKSPVSKNELDYFDVGHSILCEVKKIEEINVVIKIN